MNLKTQVLITHLGKEKSLKQKIKVKLSQISWLENIFLISLWEKCDTSSIYLKLLIFSSNLDRFLPRPYWIICKVMKGSKICHPKICCLVLIILTWRCSKRANAGRGFLWTPLICCKDKSSKRNSIVKSPPQKFHQAERTDSYHRRKS